MNHSISLDMDGVLAVYEPDDYKKQPYAFEMPGSHYFAKRTVDTVMCDVARRLEHLTHETSCGLDLFIVSMASANGRYSPNNQLTRSHGWTNTSRTASHSML